MANLEPALIVTMIGMSIIFLVLGILWLTIFALNRIFPFKAPETQSGAASAPVDDTQTVAVIQAAVTAYRKQR